MLNLNEFKVIIFDWGDTLMRDFPQYKGPMYYWPEVKLMPGVDKVLDFLYNKKIPLCIASNAEDSDTNLMKLALKRAGIERYFKYFLSSDDAGFRKPHPEFFKSIAKYVNVPISDCLMIGNDYHKDIEGAAKTGMKTVFYNFLKEKGDFPLANDIFYDYNNLLLKLS